MCCPFSKTTCLEICRSTYGQTHCYIFLQTQIQSMVMSIYVTIHEHQHCYIKTTQNEITKPSNIDRFKELKETSKNWSLVITIEDKKNLDLFTEMLKDLCHTYIFDTPARNWFELQDQLNRGVSEVYIAGYLGFCWPEVQKECEKFGVKTRAIVNYADGADFKDAPAIKKFFIRPEDYCNKILSDEEIKKSLEWIDCFIKSSEEKNWEEGILHATCNDLLQQNNLHLKDVMPTFRLILFGETNGPDIIKSIVILGKEETKIRIGLFNKKYLTP